jgi:hypothetical protein
MYIRSRADYRSGSNGKNTTASRQTGDLHRSINNVCSGRVGISNYGTRWRGGCHARYVVGHILYGGRCPIAYINRKGAKVGIAIQVGGGCDHRIESYRKRAAA